jgi:hypothetical protein
LIFNVIFWINFVFFIDFQTAASGRPGACWAASWSASRRPLRAVALASRDAEQLPLVGVS